MKKLLFSFFLCFAVFSCSNEKNGISENEDDSMTEHDGKLTADEDTYVEESDSNPQFDTEEIPDSDAAEKSHGYHKKGDYSTLTLFTYTPQNMPSEPRPLVLILHGCDQHADFNSGDQNKNFIYTSQWHELAEKYKFYIAAIQENEGYMQNCFLWMNENEIKRNSGEVSEIAAMVEDIKDWHHIDEKAVFAAGISAGGAMSLALAASYPDIFAAVAVYSGLPYGCSLNCMQGFVSKTPEQWAEKVINAAAGIDASSPAVIAFHGKNDSVVSPKNLDEIMKQWTAVHNTGQIPDETGILRGAEYRIFKDSEGEAFVKTLLIPGMNHALPVDPEGEDPEAGGIDPLDGWYGDYTEDVGLYAPYFSAEFFGIAENR
ncbi:MAG: PHB depolymerase family esterase [bacterium]